MSFSDICEKVDQTALGLIKLKAWDKEPYTSTNMGGEQLLMWAEDIIDRQAEIKAAIMLALTTPMYLAIVCAAYNSAFDSDPQLKRLDTFQSVLTHDHGTLHSRVTEALRGAELDVGVLAKNFKEQLLCADDIKALSSTLCIRVRRCIIGHVVECVKTKPIPIPNSFHFAEDDRTAETRAELMQKLENFDRAAFRIDNIGRDFVADKYEDKVLQSLLNAAEALNPNPTSATQGFLPYPARVSTTAAAQYDELGLHSSDSPTFGPSAQTQAELEGSPGSPVPSDFSFIE